MESFIYTVFNFLFLHLLGDYVFQGSVISFNKGKNKLILLIHSIIWSYCIFFGLLFIDKETVWKILFLIVGHFLIDYWKCNKRNNNQLLARDIYIDQGLHLLQILVCVLL